ncbi:hypothetical protein [Acinetobacter indicus]|uniref:hypothetical protein n=1 Tax=Acinetobacter indicus TaxID=756892 RepID=UPI00131569ED|nr:hypothetical protein [Acinetobacter indicus]
MNSQHPLATLVILLLKNNALFIQKSPVFGQTLHQAYLGQAILFKNQQRYGTHYPPSAAHISEICFFNKHPRHDLTLCWLSCKISNNF